MKVSKGTIARTLLLLLALFNQALTMGGLNPLPWAESEMYDAISNAITVVASVTAWWKNNSFTKKALLADEHLKKLKGE